MNRLVMLRSRLGSAAAFARNQARATALRRSLDVHTRDDLVTVGQFPTAGYRIPVGLLDPGSVVYSVGVGDNISFDLDLIARVGCAVHGIDPARGPRNTPVPPRHTSRGSCCIDSPSGPATRP